MKKKITIEFIKNFLQEHNPKLTLVEETFKNSYTKCKWIEEGWGEFWRTPELIVRRKFLHHPRFNGRNSITIEFIKNFLQEHNPKLTLVEETFNGVENKCKWIEEGFGEFERKVSEVIYNNALHHPISRLNRAKQTNLERYGFENPAQNPEIKKKIRGTNLNRYGVESPSKILEIREKVKKTNLERFGVEFCTQSSEIREKVKKTNLERFGVENPAQNPEIKEKSFQTQLANGTLHKSHQEQELLEYCKTLDPGTRSTIVYLKDKQFQIDILLPKFNVAIEYNGMFWHSEGNKLHYKNKHLDKTLACQERGYRLIHIWETEWLGKPQIVKNYLRSVMGLFDKRVPARKCKIQEVPKEQAKTFLNQNHLQGACSFNTALGLYYEGALVAIAVLGTHHRSGEPNVAKRFAFAQGVQVIGGISKLSKALLNLVEGGSIITWADRRLGAYGVYANSGWVLEEVLKPDYFYWSEGDRKVVSKQHYLQTKKKYGLTEREAAAKNRHLRIWDCGKYRFRMTLSPEGGHPSLGEG